MRGFPLVGIRPIIGLFVDHSATILIVLPSRLRTQPGSVWALKPRRPSFAKLTEGNRRNGHRADQTCCERPQILETPLARALGARPFGYPHPTLSAAR